MTAAAEMKVGSATIMNNDTKEQHQQTQAIIQQLFNVSQTAFMTPSAGDTFAEARDPHLRLRRTLAPSLNVGIPKYAEAQFMISRKETDGKRTSLEFGVEFDGKTKYFIMDAYVFGDVSQLYLDAAGSDGNLKLITYERGWHHNFDGTEDLPCFDDEVIEWNVSL
jgi:hypothetical protein